MTDKKPALIVFGGLPGTGKTTLSRALSRHLNTAYLRIDTIEQTLRDAGAMKVGHEGYLIAYAVAADNLRAGNTVVADSVNPVPITRDAWRDVAARSDARLIEIEVVCTDKAEHRRRVETRRADIPGHQMPTWQDVENREYEEWAGRHILIDTAACTADAAFADLLARLANIL